MKEVKIRYKDLSEEQQNSIIILENWLIELYVHNNMKGFYKTKSWLSDISKNRTSLSALDLKNLRELWDIYSAYKKINDSEKNTNIK